MKTRIRFPEWLLGVAALVLAAHACDSAPPPLTGITCLKQQPDGTILALETDNSYASADGGLTWQKYAPLAPDPMPGCGGYYVTRFPWTAYNPAHRAIVYRFNPEISIERSDDGGVTWRRELDLSGTEARTTYYVSTRNDGNEYRSGPLDALVDPKTGNLVVAMGYEGVLVRSPEGRWTWVTVGRYSRVDMRDMSITLPFISGDLWLALMLGAVVAGTLPTISRGRGFWFVVVAVICSILALGVVYSGLIALWQIPARVLSNYVSSAIMGSAWIPALAILAVVPALVSWKIATHTHQQDMPGFVWSGMGWTYMTLLLTLLVWSVTSVHN